MRVLENLGIRAERKENARKFTNHNQGTQSNTTRAGS